MQENLNHFYLKQLEPNQSCFFALREIILNLNTRINETIKYKMPCFCYGKKILCYLWKDKETNEPYILIADGNQINHSSLEQGNRKRMKVLRVNPNLDIDIISIHEVLQLGIDIHESKLNS
jgi:hypothetical protein